MMTRAEANQRAIVHRGQIHWHPDRREYSVTLNEWTAKQRREERMYCGSDIEDAVLTLGRQRHVPKRSHYG